MDPIKPWYMSRSIWGGLIAAAASLGSLFGMTLETGDQAILTEALLQAVSALGAAAAIYGRFAATSRLF
ncbi:hypothetical protein [Rhizobium sp. EC-SD404]|uniref:hypothetical protein n=1 Tax=Rhizobium sp. EC-SD404 TaxID=2038389 RepID=UPI001253F5CC|nr:hypothetical protein [Rhizobium sp. EC-SD404]VVT14257.1 conserved hypothetical protein [Rhizobium sp. EC-SD404]